MGFFSKILATLGIGDAPATATSTAGIEVGIPAPPSALGANSGAVATAPGAPPTPHAVALVDVVAELEQRAAANREKLNWRTSIVDLLKLLDIDSSFATRRELAAELGCPADLMDDSAKMNMWLHKSVLARIATHGGNVPRELLD